jgi:hypothetical protein
MAACVGPTPAAPPPREVPPAEPLLEIHTELLEPGWHFYLSVQAAELAVVTINHEGARHPAHRASLSSSEVAALRSILEAEALRRLEPSYVNPNVQDGAARHIFVRVPGRALLTTFVQNQSVPALAPLSGFLRERLPPSLRYASP